MNRRHATVLVNRRAGSGRRLGDITALIRELSGRGWRVDVQTPQTTQDIVPTIDRCIGQGTDCLIVAGGDGTWHEALQAGVLRLQADSDPGSNSATTGVPIALLPIGTGDDNARSLHIPISDPVATAHLIDIDSRRTIDLGLVHTESESRWFCGVLSVGFDSQVNARANNYRRLPGTLRYLVAAAAELARFTPSNYTITTPSGTDTVRAMLIAVGNGGHYGGGMAICPEYSHSDGQVEVTIIGALPRVRFVATLPTVYSGRHIRQRGVTTMRCNTLSIEGQDQLVFADGEPVGTVPIRVECVPRAAQVIAP